MADLAPVAPRERLLTLDVLRGFALLGVLIGNLVLYSGRWAGLAPTETRLDEIADWFVSIAVDSKAQTTLTFLFGLGFSIQLLRADERGEPVTAMYLRRLGALLVLGLLHVTLLWWGDVTWTYAVAGTGILLFTRTSVRTRVIAGLALCFVPLVALRASRELGRAAAGVFLDRGQFQAATARMAAALVGDDHLRLGWEHLRYAAVWVAGIWAWYFFWILGRFLIGHVAGQRRWFERDGADHLPVFRRLALAGGAVAAVTTTVDVLIRLGRLAPREHGAWGRAAAAVIHEAGLFAMVACYVGVAVLLLQRRWWRRVLGVIAPAGRMPLTIYFSQSLIATCCFYGWGLGWAGQVGTAGCVGLALAIFAVQVVLAKLWLRWYRFGPVDWLWRTVVYLRPPPMRIRAPLPQAVNTVSPAGGG